MAFWKTYNETRNQFTPKRNVTKSNQIVFTNKNSSQSPRPSIIVKTKFDFLDLIFFLIVSSIKENYLPAVTIRFADQPFHYVQKIPFVRFLQQPEALHHICNTTFVVHEEALLQGEI